MRRASLPMFVVAVGLIPVALLAQDTGGAGDRRAADRGIGVIVAPTVEQARAQALAWLAEREVNAAVREQVEAAWRQEQPLLDRVLRTFELADPDVARTFAELRAEAGVRPTGLVEVFQSAPPGWYRANLGVGLAKILVDRRLYEEALITLRGIQAEQVVDPAAYFFFKAVCENRLLLKDEGLKSIHRLLSTVTHAPERYRALAGLMRDEMEQWEDQDLGYIARRMHEIESRLDNGRGGPKTQEKQQEVIDLLDKQIEDLESQCQQSQGGGAGNAPKSNMPASDSRIMGAAGPGNVDNKKLVKDAKIWGKMPEKEKIKALESLSRGYPPHFKDAIEGYTKKIAEGKDGGQN